VAASLANRLLLRASMPTDGQIKFWDRWFSEFVLVRCVAEALAEQHL
jgi:hypothetical protein